MYTDRECQSSKRVEVLRRMEKYILQLLHRITFVNTEKSTSRKHVKDNDNIGGGKTKEMSSKFKSILKALHEEMCVLKHLYYNVQHELKISQRSVYYHLKREILSSNAAQVVNTIIARWSYTLQLDRCDLGILAGARGNVGGAITLITVSNLHNYNRNNNNNDHTCTEEEEQEERQYHIINEYDDNNISYKGEYEKEYHSSLVPTEETNYLHNYAIPVHDEALRVICEAEMYSITQSVEHVVVGKQNHFLRMEENTSLPYEPIENNYCNERELEWSQEEDEEHRKTEAIPHSYFVMHKNTRFIIVVEKYAIYERLLLEKLPQHLPSVLITSLGMPCMAARQLLYNLHNAAAPQIPVVLLVDCNPSGLLIALHYKYDKEHRNRCYSHQSFAITNARWLGLRCEQILLQEPAEREHFIRHTKQRMYAELRKINITYASVQAISSALQTMLLEELSQEKIRVNPLVPSQPFTARDKAIMKSVL